VGMSTVAEGSIGFREDFSEPVLDPAWTVTDTYPGHGYYSLTGNSLRYYIQAWSQAVDTPTPPNEWGYVYYPCMKLSRSFSGTDWTFETKVTYYMPYSNGRFLVMQVFLALPGSADWLQTQYGAITFYRNADLSPGSMNWVGDIDGIIQRGTLPISGTSYDTYYFRIVRKDKELTLLWSSDGQTWLGLYNTEMSDQTAELSQYVRLGGISWATPAGSYADYDYIHVEPSVIPPVNQTPTANAGPDQTAHIGTLVSLDGSGSSDPDQNYPLAYSWRIISKPQGSEAELFDSTLVNPSFIADVSGDYTVELIVTDSLGLESMPDLVVISTYNTAPVAEAGEDQAVIEIGSLVQLNGSQSYDVDGDDITYFWTISQKPDGSLAELSDPYAIGPSFVVDVHGDYIVTLVVTDILGAASQPDSMTVSFSNVKPVAVPGGNQAVVEGDTVCLDGSGSYDGNGDELIYNWSIVSKPSGSNAELSNSNTVNPCFVADKPGAYVISLIVNDGFVDSDAANVSVMAISNEDAASMELISAMDTINEFAPASFKNNNMGNALTNKINAALELIDQGYYIDAIDKLLNDILQKTNGCAETGAPDRNDWIVTCSEQGQVYPLILEVIQYLEEAIQ